MRFDWWPERTLESIREEAESRPEVPDIKGPVMIDLMDAILSPEMLQQSTEKLRRSNGAGKSCLHNFYPLTPETLALLEGNVSPTERKRRAQSKRQKKKKDKAERRKRKKEKAEADKLGDFSFSGMDRHTVPKLLAIDTETTHLWPGVVGPYTKADAEIALKVYKENHPKLLVVADPAFPPDTVALVGKETVLITNLGTRKK